MMNVIDNREGGRYRNDLYLLNDGKYGWFGQLQLNCPPNPRQKWQRLA